MGGYAPRAREDSFRPRRLMGASGRLLNFTVRQHVDAIPDRSQLLLSLQRALLGAVHTQLRQASIELDPGSQLVRVRFEYDGPPDPAVKERCSGAATELIADFPAPWDLDVQHRVAPYPQGLTGLKYVAYRRAEG